MVGVPYHMGWNTPYSMVGGGVPYHIRVGYTLLHGGGTLPHRKEGTPSFMVEVFYHKGWGTPYSIIRIPYHMGGR